MCDGDGQTEYIFRTTDQDQADAWLLAERVIAAIMQADNEMRKVTKYGHRPADCDEWSMPEHGVRWARETLAVAVKEALSRDVI